MGVRVGRVMALVGGVVWMVWSSPATAESGRYRRVGCPYEAPLNKHGDFDIERIPERELFPLLPDRTSVLGARAYTASYANLLDGDHGQTLALGYRYGGPELHPWVHLFVGAEVPYHGIAPYDVDAEQRWPRFNIGVGVHKIDGWVGGYVHYGLGIRANVRFAGDRDAIQVVRPFDEAQDDIPVSLTEELRIAIPGCLAWFGHVTLEQRNYGDVASDIFSSAYKLPARLMLGFYPRAWLGIAGELGIFYDPTRTDSEEEKFLLRWRAIVEILPADPVRFGVSIDTIQRDDREGAFLGVYVEVVP